MPPSATIAASATASENQIQPRSAMSEPAYLELLEDKQQILLPLHGGSFAFFLGDLIYAKDSETPKARSQSGRIHVQAMNGTSSTLESSGYTELAPGQIYRFTNVDEPGKPAFVQLAGEFILRPHS